MYIFMLGWEFYTGVVSVFSIFSKHTSVVIYIQFHFIDKNVSKSELKRIQMKMDFH